MCNLYSVTTNQSAIAAFARAVRDTTGNLPPMPHVNPNTLAPIVRNGNDGKRELVMARWGMPTPQNILMEGAKKKASKFEAKGTPYDFKELLRMERDTGITNIRNVSSKHWKQWLGLEHRCVVPFTSFSEFNAGAGGDIWFGLSEDRPLAFFAGIHVPKWTSVRKVKDGETTDELYGFLTTEPNVEVGAIHPKAMPVILRTQGEVDRWMTAPVEDVPMLHLKLPDNSLMVVAKGVKEDGLAA
jgi:putative SOS response-associated peptidase YedK